MFVVSLSFIDRRFDAPPRNEIFPVATVTLSFLARKPFQPMSGFPDDVMFWSEK